MAGPEQVKLGIRSVQDVIIARREGRVMAESLGFSTSEATMLATAISELARNILKYVGMGEVTLRANSDMSIVVIARDSGPGIMNPEAALQPGYSTAGGLGLGLPGVRRIADSFDLQTGPKGTTVTITMSRL